MAKAICFIRMAGGAPDVDFSATPIHGYSLGGTLGGWGLYVVTGTNGQLVALNALSQVAGIAAVTDNGTVRWAELDERIGAAVRAKLNTWLAAHDYPTIPSTWTRRRVVQAIIDRMTDGSPIGGFDVAEPAS